jgi:DNA-binding XRE family transcriptional regulator
MPRKKTRDALEIIDRRYFKTRKAQAMLEEARASAEIARKIYQLREDAGLTQAELAKLVGTSRTVITRLEDDDYEGHSFSMLRRVAAAVGKRVEIRFVPVKRGERAA